MRVFFSACAFFVVVCAGCDPDVRDYDHGGDVVVHHLNIGIGNVYALEGEDGVVVVDLGEKGDFADIEGALDFAGIALADVTLVVMTHGHFDHLGPAKEFQDEGLVIALGADDVDFAEDGFSEPPPSQTPEGDVIRVVLDKGFPSFTPDLSLGSELDLHGFGVAGRVVGTPGHTKGSVSVMLENGDVFVGDLVRGDREGSGPDPHQGVAVTHYFSENPRGDVDAVDALITDGGRLFFPGHGPFFDADSLNAWSVDRRAELDAPAY